MPEIVSEIYSKVVLVLRRLGTDTPEAAAVQRNHIALALRKLCHLLVFGRTPATNTRRRNAALPDYCSRLRDRGEQAQVGAASHNTQTRNE